jgi:Xaa-Pro aminopeptidase
VIQREEFEERRQALRRRLQARRLPGALIFGRGGGGYDRHGDLLYLTNHYPAMPYLPDRLPAWAMKGHAVLLMKVDGGEVLGVDNPDFVLDEVAVARVEIGNDIVDLAARLARAAGLTGRVGVIGWDALPATSADRLRAALPDLALIDSGVELEALRLVKSPAELDLVRRAATTAVAAMRRIVGAVSAGATEADVVAAGAAEVVRRGARIQYAAVASGAFSPLYVRRPVTGYDAHRPLAVGDLLHVDLLLTQDGYYADFQRSLVVGGDGPDAALALIGEAQRGVETAIANIRPGALAEDVARAGEAYKAERQLDREFGRVHPPGWEGRPQSVGDIDFDFWGHGLGLGLEAPFLRSGDRTPLLPGFVLAVEQFLVRRGVGGASWEEEVIVTEDGCEILTGGV